MVNTTGACCKSAPTRFCSNFSPTQHIIMKPGDGKTWSCFVILENSDLRVIFQQENESDEKPSSNRNDLKQILMSWSGYGRG